MPNATARGLHQINQPLSNLSLKYSNEQKDYIADKIFGTLPVKKESDAYYIFGKDNFRVEESIRADGAKANEVTYSLSTSTYSLNPHALRELVTDRQRDNADSGLEPDTSAMENLVDKILLKKETQLAALLLTTTAGGGSHSLTSTLKWTALTTISDPIGDVNTATTVIKINSAKQANTMVIPYDSWKGLKNHPNILERIKYSERGIITTDLLKAVFDIENIFIGSNVQNTSAEGDPDSLSMVWDASTWIGYVNPSPGLRKISAGYNFVKTNGGNPYAVKKYRDEEREGDWIEVGCFWDAKIVATACAYVVKGTD